MLQISVFPEAARPVADNNSGPCKITVARAIAQSGASVWCVHSGLL